MTDDINKSRGCFEGKNKRVLKRYSLDLTVEVITSDNTTIPFRISDFCDEGMLLVVDANQHLEGQLQEDDQIEIHIPLEQTYLIQARIVHQDADSSGVMLLEPDVDVMKKLMALSDATQKPDIDNQGLAQHADTDVIAECTELVITYLLPLATNTHERIVDSLFEQSKTLKDIVEQNLYFESLGILNNNKERFISLFSQFIIQRMASSQNGEIPDKDTQSGAFSTEEIELAIVEEEVLDKWLADTGTIESVQRIHNEVLAQLTRRLSELFATPISHDNNPYGPALFTQAFQEAISAFGLSHKIILVCHKVFKVLLTNVLGQLYKELNGCLISRGILPDLKYNIPKSSEPEEDIRQVYQDKNIESASSNNMSGGSNDGSGNNESNSGHVTSSRNDSIKSNDTISNRDMSKHNIYELVSELRTLKRQLKNQPSYSGSSSGDFSARQNGHQTSSAAVDVVAQGAALTTNEVVQTLARIESSCAELDREDFKELIYSSLVGEAGENGETKVIAPRENKIIDVSNSIFDTILSDTQVPESMHAWLTRLEIPVLKMAIEDDSLFMDREHLVRQVVNKIAQLGLLIGEEETEGTNSVRAALDWLVNLINSEFDGTLGVFRRVSDQLDILIKAQDKKYADQLEKVIDEFESKAPEKEEVAPDIEKEFSSESEHEKWLRRAHRLKEGDWILFDLDKEQNKRLRAAWIAPHVNKIVFVDVLGNKDRFIFFEELAVLLFTGKAVLLDDANEPAMDRAQYSMLQDLNEQLVYESTHDQLTGLINRREFEKVIGKALISARHASKKHALCFFDIDQFNILNTANGYEAGDMLLVEIAKLLSDNQIHNCVLARLGADEFGLLIEDIDLEDSLSIAEEYIYQIRDHKFMWEGKRLSTGASTGLVTINAQSESITSLMQAAESSCAIAKDTGGNRLQLYRSGQQRFAHRNEVINWVSRIDDVLDQDRLKLRCQRIQPLDSSDEAKPHYEVLLVMHDEHGDQISIQDFIEAAELGNRITDIDHWVIKETLAWISNNKSILDSVDSFSINLSGRSLSDDRLVDYILEQINGFDVPSEALCFEITETIGIENLSDSAEFIKRIKETGCQFSLDDFGSGMSSYAYLKNLPVDYLKIDGSFVKEIKTSISDYAVVKSICEIGHFMGKRVIAEYAEDAEIIEMLSEIGVDFVQGYGVEKPIMISELSPS